MNTIQNRQREISRKLKSLQEKGHTFFKNGQLSDEAKEDLRLILNENQLYEEVLEQINKRLRLQGAVANA